MRNASWYGIGATCALMLLVAGCGESAPSAASLSGKWQEISSGNVGQYGQVIEFLPGHNLSLGDSAATYTVIDNTHLKLIDPTMSVILGLALSNNRLTLTMNGTPNIFARVSGTRLPLETMPSPVDGTWCLTASTDTLYIGDATVHMGDCVRFDGNGLGGTMTDGAVSAAYTVSDQSHISTGDELYGDIHIVSKTRNSLVLEEPELFDTLTFNFTKAN